MDIFDILLVSQVEFVEDKLEDSEIEGISIKVIKALGKNVKDVGNIVKK